MKSKHVLICLILLLVAVLSLVPIRNSREFIPTLIGFVVTFSATTLGVYLAFYLNAESENKASRRREKYGLGLIWKELRVNKSTLKQIKLNFSFQALLNIKTINFLFNKFNNLYEVSKNINKNTFYSLLSSGFIKDIKNEDVLNAILIVYENLDYLNTEMTVTRLDFNQKSEVSTEIKNGAMDAQGMSLILNMTEDKIKENEEELNLAIAAVDKAIDSVEKELKHLGCKLEYEERKVLLENVEQKK